MQPSEAVGAAAQVAVTLVGFAGIVVVFRPQSLHEWSAVDRLRLRLLLTNSALPLVYSLFAILLLSIDPIPITIWRWCSGVAVLTQIVFITSSGRAGRHLSGPDFQAINKTMFYGIVALGVLAIILQLINLAVWNRFWPFFFVIFVHLVAAIVQFLRLVLLPPDSGSNVTGER